MAGRRPGPPPKERKARTNVDPVVGRDGWTELEAVAFDGDVPEIPAWVAVSARGEAIYAELASLPQARMWGRGTWLELHLTLPLIERYLSRPGSENFKAIISTLGAGLRLTEDDLQKARVKFKSDVDPEDAPPESGTVTDIDTRRGRLTRDAS